MSEQNNPNPSPFKVPKIPMPDFSSIRRPEVSVPAFSGPLKNALVEAAQANYASEFHKRLASWIKGFDAQLDQAHEVGVRLVSFGQTVIFHLHDIGYWNPSLIMFSGVTDDDQPVHLIQHVSQISVLLMKLPRKDPSKPKQPIGFAGEQDPSGEQGM